MKLDVLLLMLLALLFFGFGVCCGQVSVMHFNSEWNADNNVDISKLKECKTENITICHDPDAKKKHNIVSVPTIIILDEGVEVKRYVANIMMQLEISAKEIQKEVDKIMLKKFE
tara:strand:- start:189 stop:530 length:342 start_codon:yes stop_codon:yes gene_type:complete